MVKIAVGFGGSHGKGVATCRTASGHWSAPAPITITGGSWGLQLGGQAVDLVMIVTNDDGMQHLLSSKFKIGADASAAAGPVGRDAGADTDWKMRAEMLTYSRARGLFAGTVPGRDKEIFGPSKGTQRTEDAVWCRSRAVVKRRRFGNSFVRPGSLTPGLIFKPKDKP